MSWPRPDEHRIQLTDVFSTTHGKHNLKFGFDANIVHEVMINLFQGGGIYTYTDTNTCYQLPGLGVGRHSPDSQAIPNLYAGYHYDKFVADHRRSEYGGRHAG